MLDEIVLGARPVALTVHLTTGADFYCVLRNRSGDYAVGATLTLTLPSTTWTATIAADLATFNVDKAITNAVADGTPVKLVYTSGSSDQVWAVGAVVRNG